VILGVERLSNKLVNLNRSCKASCQDALSKKDCRESTRGQPQHPIPYATPCLFQRRISTSSVTVHRVVLPNDNVGFSFRVGNALALDISIHAMRLHFSSSWSARIPFLITLSYLLMLYCTDTVVVMYILKLQK